MLQFFHARFFIGLRAEIEQNVKLRLLKKFVACVIVFAFLYYEQTILY